MSDAAHTPGPWTLNDYGATSRERLITGGDPLRTVVARPESWGGPTREEADANARLIAAAPELLVALKAMLANYGPPIDSLEYPAWHSITLARAAIAKATP